MATGKQKIRRFQRPHSSLKTSQQETPSNIYCQKLELLAYISALIVWVFIMLQIEHSESKTASAKTEFYVK